MTNFGGDALCSSQLDFESARKTLRTEHEMRRAELTAEGTLYKMRPETLSFWRTDRRPPAFLPNKFH